MIRPLHDWIAALIVFAIAMTIGFSCQPAHASINEVSAIRAILGESRGDGYDGLYATACALRNRGTLRGVYGLRADISNVSGELYQTASRAWAVSEDGFDVTLGADHWLSDYDITHQRHVWKKWIHQFEKTVKIGHTTYYKKKYIDLKTKKE